jgi:hypothetical protein
VRSSETESAALAPSPEVVGVLVEDLLGRLRPTPAKMVEESLRTHQLIIRTNDFGLARQEIVSIGECEMLRMSRFGKVAPLLKGVFHRSDVTLTMKLLGVTQFVFCRSVG